jgi:hypothetical protein
VLLAIADFILSDYSFLTSNVATKYITITKAAPAHTNMNTLNQINITGD